MSYSSRVYRQRNPKKDDAKKDPFFSKKKDGSLDRKANSFFQAKMDVSVPGDPHEKEADAVADRVVNKKEVGSDLSRKEAPGIQRLSTTSEEEVPSSNDQRMERDKEKPFQRKAAEHDKEKPVQKMDDPKKEKDKSVQKAEDPGKDKEKGIQKKENPMQDKEKKLQKADDPKKDKKRPS